MTRQHRKFHKNDNFGHLLIALQLLLTFITVSSAALFRGCDHNYTLNAGNTFLESPYYPENYPAGSSCRYKFTAPLDYDITIECDINLAKNISACTTEYFYVATDGDLALRGAEQFCGQGRIERKTLFRSAVIAYISYGATGHFRCKLFTAPQPCDCGWSINSKIVNGQQTNINEYPSMVGLHDHKTSIPIYCGAAILSHRYILTAAHCVRLELNPANIFAIVGEHDLLISGDTHYTQTYRISSIIEHPSYTDDPITNDLALLYTATDIEWSRGVGPICLPPSSSSSETFVHQFVDVIGWGSVHFMGPSSNVLQKVVLQVVSTSDCKKEYVGFTPIYDTQLCTRDPMAQRRDSCQYDSGGPVILRLQRQFLVGVISFGKVCGLSVGVNTRITSYLQWIKHHIGETCDVPLK